MSSRRVSFLNRLKFTILTVLTLWDEIQVPIEKLINTLRKLKP